MKTDYEEKEIQTISQFNSTDNDEQDRGKRFMFFKDCPIDEM